MKDIKVEIAQFKEMVDKEIQYPYLMKHINAPMIDEDKLVLLYLIFNETNISKQRLSNYIVTTMLVQAALDAHETVSVHEINGNDSLLKNRQLTVLAGDYYSGMYYHLLAKINDIPMIRTLAGAIKDINEHKISVYRQDSSGIEQLMNSVQIIESSLLQKCSNYFNLPYMKEIVAEFFLLRRLENERKKFVANEASSVFEALKSIVITTLMTNEETFERLLEVCDSYIVQTKRKLETLLSNITDQEFLHAFLSDYLGLGYEFAGNKAVKEG